MLLIPELETVVILVPRTGSGALRRALQERYPRAMLVYRHMEADGIPTGYDRWRKVGVVRNPIDRLWSLYKFCHVVRMASVNDHNERLLASVNKPFEEWLLTNEAVFTTPYAGDGKGFLPLYSVRHHIPENRKSQWLYLRPDLGTEVWRFEDKHRLADELGVTLPSGVNVTAPTPAPFIGGEALVHMWQHFAWDFDAIQKRPANNNEPYYVSALARGRS